MFARVFFVLVALSLPFVSQAAEDETTESRLARYGDEMSKAWVTYPTAKDDTVRKQKIMDLNQTISAEIQKLDAPANTTMQKSVDNLTANLQRIRALFKQPDKMKQEINQYTSMCVAVFRRESKTAADLSDERTVSKCFEIVADWCEAARKNMFNVPDDAHQPVFTAYAEVFNAMLKAATKDTEDPTAVYDRQLKEIKRRFPMTSPVFQKSNQPIVSVLESAAKQANTFNKKP